MTATHTLSEAQITELNRAIRAALSRSRDAGFAASSYIHDHNTHESILARRRDAAAIAATAAQADMWEVFYTLMSAQPAGDRFASAPVGELLAAGRCPHGRSVTSRRAEACPGNLAGCEVGL